MRASVLGANMTIDATVFVSTKHGEAMTIDRVLYLAREKASMNESWSIDEELTSNRRELVPARFENSFRQDLM